MKNIAYRCFILMFLLLLGSKSSFSFSKGERDTTQVECNIYYKLSSSEIEQSYKDNSIALKTNLLFDAATLINVELEIPIKNRWSIAGEWIFPWWKNCNGKEDSKRNRTQLLNGNIDLKYWFGNREKYRVLTGWFASVYVGGGIYDFERGGKGYQGEFFIAAGLSGGYAHSIGKNLSMEYSLGIGYLQTHYRYYKACWGVDERWRAVRKNSSTFTWIGPTKAKVSLVWLINHKVRKGGIYE